MIGLKYFEAIATDRGTVFKYLATRLFENQDSINQIISVLLTVLRMWAYGLAFYDLCLHPW